VTSAEALLDLSPAPKVFVAATGAGAGIQGSLPAVARQSLYLHLLEDTESIFDVGARIRAFRHSVQARPRVPIPH
jgi:hypothetical protein